MSTYRRFSLDTNEQDQGVYLSMVQDFRQTCESANFTLTETGDSAEGQFSWREHETDLAEFSKRHPETLFSLWVTDDCAIDDEDEFVVYALNGKIQVEYPEKTYPDFDMKKTREPQEWA